jgi:hypothetical protein
MAVNFNDFAFAGSVSSGTIREEDLVPAFLSVLRELDPKATEILDLEFEEIRRDHDWDSEEISRFLNETLWDALEANAPDGWYFGAHPGDGADYGFWPLED